jgi:ParB family transcriptional regulator, chromosome partitioning protein
MSRLESSSLLIAGVIQDLNINRIKPYSVCRFTTDDTLDDLSNSIKQKGLLQPIIVRTKPEYFEIVAGNRRYNACKSLGWRKIACHVVELDDKEAFEVSLIENIQRKSLNPIDEAYAFKKYVADFGWGGVTELASKLGKSIGYVTKRIKLLDLPPDILNLIVSSAIRVSIAEELFSIKDITKQTKLAQIISDRHLSLRKTRKLLEDIDDKSCDFEYDNRFSYFNNENSCRIFDKSIITLRLAMIKLCELIEAIQDNWVVYELLVQHKNIVHAQIDLLIKEKKKMTHNINRSLFL